MSAPAADIPPPRPQLPDGAALTAVLSAALRAEGVDVAITSELVCTDAVAAVGLDDRLRLYVAARASLVHRPADFDAYDRAFARVFGGPPQALQPRPLDPPPLRVVLHHDAPGAVDRDLTSPSPSTPEDLTLRFSDLEVLRQADLATLTAAEVAQAHALISALRTLGPFRRGRRQRPTRGHGRGDIDLRRTVGRALSTGGEALSLVSHRPMPTQRRVVLLVDVSGSMEPYARAMLRLAHAVATGRRRAEVFAMGTRLTRLTRALSTHDPDVALAQAADQVQDWAGGTRLGQSLAAFNDTWGIRGLARGAVVVILSDGWDRGDPAQVAEQMGRLHRVAHRIVWVNPVAADPGFAPIAAGMAAALPFVDDLREGHSVAALESLVEALSQSVGRNR